MIEILAVVALFLLFRLLVKKRNNEKGSSADQKEKNCRKLQPASIVGESRFVLGPERKKQAEVIEPDTDSSCKLDIEIPLEYEPENTDLLEEQEELERLGLPAEYSSNITFDDMISVVNEVGNVESAATHKTGELLYANENTDWLEQLASASESNSKRITSLIDLHLGKLIQPSSEVEPDDGLVGFDIGEYVR